MSPNRWQTDQETPLYKRSDVTLQELLGMKGEEYLTGASNLEQEKVYLTALLEMLRWFTYEHNSRFNDVVRMENSKGNRKIDRIWKTISNIIYKSDNAKESDTTYPVAYVNAIRKLEEYDPNAMEGAITLGEAIENLEKGLKVMEDFQAAKGATSIAASKALN